MLWSKAFAERPQTPSEPKRTLYRCLMKTICQCMSAKLPQMKYYIQKWIFNVCFEWNIHLKLWNGVRSRQFYFRRDGKLTNTNTTVITVHQLYIAAIMRYIYKLFTFSRDTFRMSSESLYNIINILFILLKLKLQDAF